MTVIHHLPSLSERADLTYYWNNMKHSLQGYFVVERKSGRCAQRIGYQAREFVDKIQQLPEFEPIIYTAQNKQRNDYPWHRYELAYDEAMQIELVTVFGDYPTPLHSYDGPAGLLHVIQGKLTLYRYRELNHEVTEFSTITKLECQITNNYQSTQSTVVDSVATPVVQMQANSERSIFFNIHLKDNVNHHHFFYYPCYGSREQPQFFTRRVPAEW
jgi:hypothetical protein